MSAKHCNICSIKLLFYCHFTSFHLLIVSNRTWTNPMNFIPLFVTRNVLVFTYIQLQLTLAIISHTFTPWRMVLCVGSKRIRTRILSWSALHVPWLGTVLVWTCGFDASLWNLCFHPPHLSGGAAPPGTCTELQPETQWSSQRKNCTFDGNKDNMVADWLWVVISVEKAILQRWLVR